MHPLLPADEENLKLEPTLRFSTRSGDERIAAKRLEGDISHAAQGATGALRCLEHRIARMPGTLWRLLIGTCWGHLAIKLPVPHPCCTQLRTSENRSVPGRSLTALLAQRPADPQRSAHHGHLAASLPWRPRRGGRASRPRASRTAQALHRCHFLSCFAKTRRLMPRLPLRVNFSATSTKKSSSCASS